MIVRTWWRDLGVFGMVRAMRSPDNETEAITLRGAQSTGRAAGGRPGCAIALARVSPKRIYMQNRPAPISCGPTVF